MATQPLAYLPKIVGRTEQERRLIDKLYDTLRNVEQAICLAPKGEVRDDLHDAHGIVHAAYEKVAAEILNAPQSCSHTFEDCKFEPSDRRKAIAADGRASGIEG